MPELHRTPTTTPVNPAWMRDSLKREPACDIRNLVFEVAYARGFVIFYPGTTSRRPA